MIIRGSGGIYGTTSNTFITPFIEYDYETDDATNYTNLTATLYYGRTDKYKTYGTGTFTLNINGNSTVETKYIEIMEVPVGAITVTERIKHNDDGTKTVYIAGAGTIPGTSLERTNISGSVTLPTVPRASTIYSASNVNFGEPCGVRWKPLSKNLYYRLKFSMGSFSVTSGVIHPGTTSLYFYDGTIIPLLAAEQIPNSMTGTMTATLYTYSDSAGTVQVGDGDSKTFYVNVPFNEDTAPYVTDIALTPEHSLGSTFAGLYIQGHSKVKVTSSEKGQLGATVVWKNITVEGKEYGSGSNYTSDYLSTYGTVNVKLTLKDSRGITNTMTRSITVIPYTKPRVVPRNGETSVVCGRCDESGNLTHSGTSLRIRARRNFSPCLADGVQKNFCGLRFRYKETSDSDFSEWQSLISATDTTMEEIDIIVLKGALSKTTTYVVQVDAVDSIPNHTYVQFDIPSEEVYLHKAGSIGSLGIGEFVEDANIISIAKSKPIRVKSNINGVRMYNKSVSGTKDLDIKTKYADFTGTGNERQSFFVFGEANGKIVYGVARVANNGTTLWGGTEGVTLTTKTGGVLTVVLPTVAYDVFTIISGRDFSV